MLHITHGQITFLFALHIHGLKRQTENCLNVIRNW